MSIFIRNIHIENFRSIRKLTIPVGKLSLFVGKNDSGKSNILRALNLFFNEETNYHRPLNFLDDYNFFYTPPARKAKEIIVRLELELPESYRATNGDYIVWEKRWRANGLQLNRYWGVRESVGPRGRRLQQEVVIPERSNLHSLLKKFAFSTFLRLRTHYFLTNYAAKFTRLFQKSHTTHLEHQVHRSNNQLDNIFLN
jgi:predicted ATP-dependent endonuclease of OLD family